MFWNPFQFLRESNEPFLNLMSAHGATTYHNDTQHNDIQRNSKLNPTISIMTLNIMVEYCYTECHTSLYAVSLWWMSLCWVSLCWVSRRPAHNNPIFVLRFLSFVDLPTIAERKNRQLKMHRPEKLGLNFGRIERG